MTNETPGFAPRYAPQDLYEILRSEVPWVNRSAPRDECFMAVEGAPTTYSYGNNNARREELHTYRAVAMHPAVQALLEQLNRGFGTAFNVCVLNYYSNERQHLGWHADDSPEQDLTHPIAVVSFGAAREIWWKPKDFKGELPAENKVLLPSQSLFWMPGGFQDGHYHRIPKHGSRCGGRVSLTFRKLVR